MEIRFYNSWVSDCKEFISDRLSVGESSLVKGSTILVFASFQLVGSERIFQQWNNRVMKMKSLHITTRRLVLVFKHLYICQRPKDLDIFIRHDKENTNQKQMFGCGDFFGAILEKKKQNSSSKPKIEIC